MAIKRIGFDNQKYLEEQSRAILERAERIGGRLYLEFGGKVAHDYHAARVLPGYDPNVKVAYPTTSMHSSSSMIFASGACWSEE